MTAERQEDAQEPTDDQQEIDAPTRRGRGRPTKLTPAIQETICTAIRMGLRYQEACTIAHITDVTYRRWKDVGEAAKTGKFRDFYLATKEAEAEGEQKLLSIVQEVAEKGTEEATVVTHRDANGVVTSTVTTQKRSPRDWRAAMTILERRYPERYGRKVLAHEGIPETPAPTSGPTVMMFFDDGEGEEDAGVYVNGNGIEMSFDDGGGDGDEHSA